MRSTKPVLLTSVLLALATQATPSWAQTPADGGLLACPSQSALEQSLDSAGAITPDDCTTLQVNALRSDNGDLCLIDFGLDQGFIGQLREAAFPTQWWVRCDELATKLAQ